MSALLDLVYAVVALLAGAALVFGIWAVSREEADPQNSTADLLRAIAVSVFLALVVVSVV
ncbi:hypothetical protein [Salarchaeum sp. JOR-1]|uniref:hypothetical protein n=1 Tax=Salarchaeum sp. JOR-1 TaxID=2599399 RepID=UPI0011988DCE|nr:hypothetical protein [Salarchaeum sp. JOR-1]QDX41394.1 hypothetical protein FQU85_10965 [Salarchaeum sp. JOR-1]